MTACGPDTMGLSGEVARALLEALQTRAEVTLSSLAAHCGISTATASRALSGHPNVRPQVREKVRAAAERLGYKRNPLVGTLMAQVRGARTCNFAGNLAIVHIASPHVTTFFASTILTMVQIGLVIVVML